MLLCYVLYRRRKTIFYANLLIFWALSLVGGHTRTSSNQKWKDQALARRGGYISRIVAVLRRDIGLVIQSQRGEEDNEWNGPAVAIEDRMSLSEASPLIRSPVRALSIIRKYQAQVQGEKDQLLSSRHNRS